MKLEDAPPPGWYPDPEQVSRLRWWQGTDWSEQRREFPSSAEEQTALRDVADAANLLAGLVPSATGQGVRRSDADRIVSQVKEATREEIDRAADLFSRRTQIAIERGRSLITGYFDLVFRWIKIAVLVAAVLVVAWFVLQFLAQITLLQWLGDRIDNFTGG